MKSPFGFQPRNPHFNPVIIAEMGTSHQGNLSRALELVDAATLAGADIIKVQAVFAEEIIPPEVGLVDLQSGPVELFDRFRNMERGIKFYQAIAEQASRKGIGFLASCFGPRSKALLEQLGIKAWKVASPEINHEELIKDLARTGLPIILSTGISKPADISRALEIIRKTPEHHSNHILHPQPFPPPITLMHCITSYPAPEEDANLRLIPQLAKTYQCPVGISDHSSHTHLIPCLATSMGAVAIEKHIRPHDNLPSLDDSVALRPEPFATMVQSVRKLQSYTEKEAMEHLVREFGKKRIDAALGDGIKRLAHSEETNYGRTNRSLHAVGALPAHTIINPQNTAILRTEKRLRIGIEPRHRHKAYGRRLIHNIASGDGIVWEDLA